MLTSTQKNFLLAFGQIIADVVPNIEVHCIIRDGQEKFSVVVYDDGNWFAFNGVGSTLEAAYEKVVRSFEGHSMGCPRASVQEFLDNQEQTSMILDVSAYAVDDNEIDIDVRPAQKGREAGATRAKDMDPGPGRRWKKEQDGRHERREVRAKLRDSL